MYELLIGFFSFKGLFAATTGLFGILFGIALALQLWASEKDVATWRNFVSQGSFKAFYQKYMCGFLDWLDHKLSGYESEVGKGPVGIAWSIGLAEFWGIVAIAYPMFMIFGQWVATNQGDISGLVIFEPTADWRRALASLGVGISAFLYFLSGRVKSAWRFPLFILATLILVAVAVAVAGAVAVAVAVAVAGAGAGAVAGAGAGAVAGAVAVAVAVAVTYDNFRQVLLVRGSLRAWVSLHYSLLILCLVSLTIVLLDQLRLTPSGDDPTGVILFLCFLPITNAIFDFFSIGLTRFCLRKGLDHRTLKWVIIDIVGGAVLFAALGCSLIILLHFVRPEDGVPLLDVPALLNDMATRDGAWRDYIWLIAMAATTVLPTMLHAIFGMLGVLMTVPTFLTNRIVGWLDAGLAGHRTCGLTAFAAISSIISLAVSLPFWAAYIVFHAFDWAILRWVLDGFIWFANLWVGVYWPA